MSNPNNNLEFLSLIHMAQSTADNAQKAIKLMLDRSENGIVNDVPATHLFALNSLIALQSRLIKGLTEENQTIIENLEGFIKKALDAE